MGYNTTVLFLNDALHQLETDPNAGKKLALAISEALHRGARRDVALGNHVNAATVIETHHADYTSIIAVGGNTAYVLGSLYGWKWDPEQRDLKQRVMEMFLREQARKKG